MRSKLSPAQRSRRLKFWIAAFLAFIIFFILTGGSNDEYDPATFPIPSSGAGIHHSIVIPAYKEKDNIRPLVTRIFAALRDPEAAEVVIVDDNSRDGTVEEVAALVKESHNVVLITRVGEKGLSSAVLRGMKDSRGESIVVMDADLQHPPEAVQGLFDALDNPETPFALGTRYGAGVAMDSNWPLYRRVISWGARSLARPLTSASDPMSGFFGIKKEYIRRASPINPSGFKIALELLLKSPLPRNGIADVPFDFGTRSVGESKLSSKVMVRYVLQLLALYRWSWGIFFPMLLAGLSVSFIYAGVTALYMYRVWRAKDADQRRSKRRSMERSNATLKPPANTIRKKRSRGKLA